MKAALRLVPNQGVLVMLDDSARNSTFARSVTANFLKPRVGLY